MEHSVEYTLADGTEYRFTWDTEDKGGQMHYLIHENGTLRLECWHHAVPEGWTDEKLKSMIVPGTFFNCVARHLQSVDMAAQIEGMDDGPLKQLAQMAVRPHMTLSPEQEAYLRTFQERGHDVELLVKIMQDAEVEAFAARLNEEPGMETTVTITGGEIIPVQAKGILAWVTTYWPALLWVAAVAGGLVAYYLLVR